jgi:DNA-binding response OmpR family regulator
MTKEKINLLVVEDDDQLRESLQRHLSEKNYDVSAASNGNEAIPLIHGREFRLIVLDLKMPYLDGFQVLQFVKSTFPNTRVIVLTGYGSLANVQKCKTLGADEVIPKPYNLEHLFDTIQRLITP